MADIFKLLFHIAAKLKEDRRPYRGIERAFIHRFNIGSDDLRAALTLYTEHVSLEDWISAAIEKNDRLGTTVEVSRNDTEK